MTLENDEKACPFCAETIKAAAKVCRHCGRDLPAPPPRPGIFGDRVAPTAARVRTTTGASTAGRLVLLCVIAPAACFALSGGNPYRAILLLMLVAPFVYFIPSYEAWARSHPNLAGVVLLNVFLGWTLLGWVAALVWSVSAKRTP